MRSIQRHVAAWTLGASLLGAVVLGGTAYVAVLDEMNEMLDANLREVASTVARLPSLPGPVPAASVTSGPDAELEIVIQAWTPTRERLFSSRPTLALPFIEGEGLSRVRLAGIDWDVYTLRRADRVVQAAQRARAQGVEAAESTGRILLTLLAVAAVVGLLMWLALRRGLRSLQDAATMVAARSPQRLTPITDDSAPRELKPLVQAINALMRRLSDALAMQRRFVADAAHALRTPVTALRLQVDLLDAARDDGARRAASAELRSGVDRAQRLIEQLLLLSRSERDALAPSLQSVALSTLARDAVARFAARADRAGIDLGARIDADALVEADAAQLAVLLDNLIDNALRHTSAGSTIDVVTSLETEGPTLSVVDGGPGIAADERARVFDRFYRGAPAADGASELGSGLGLAIAKAIADAHDATLSLRDGPPGRGLAVVLSFRRPAAGVARAAAAT